MSTEEFVPLITVRDDVMRAVVREALTDYLQECLRAIHNANPEFELTLIFRRTENAIRALHELDREDLPHRGQVHPYPELHEG